MKSFDSSFTILDLKNKFPGVEEYVFISYIYPEMEKDLINISNKEFIYYEKLELSDTKKNELREVINSLFEQLQSSSITVSKLYSKIKLTKKELYEQLQLHYGSYYLFSLLKYLFKNEYYFNRPVISKNKDESLSMYQLVQKYAKSKNIFNHADIKNYIDKMNLGTLYSYLSFMEDMSEEYVQIDLDVMQRKEEFNIDNNVLLKIDSTLKMILNNFGEINTTTFKAYQLLPNIKYDWNKYLLVGIVRTYLNDKYIIENTENKYTSTEFIIRSDINE